jgi:hypothetical protein
MDKPITFGIFAFVFQQKVGLTPSTQIVFPDFLRK